MLVVKKIVFLVPLLLGVLSASAQFHLPLEVRDGRVQELGSGQSYAVHGEREAVSVPAAVGEGWRTDGYSSYIEVPVTGIRPNGMSTNMRDSVLLQMTVSFWCAIETYPMMSTATLDYANPLYTSILGNINDSLHTGFAFELSDTGRLRFRCYTAGWQITCAADQTLARNTWHHLVAIVDCYEEKVRLYDNGTLLSERRCGLETTLGAEPLLLGKSRTDILDGIFPLNYFNGLIDEVRIDAGIKDDPRTTPEPTPANAVQLSVPISAYSHDLMRPRYHGMPSQGWTNEPHGLIFANNRWHIFFQKNGNGPYMARLHWGHISSPDLCHWTEEPVALAPSELYDLKGCWSGCVFSDPDITNNEPYILYSAVNDSHCELMLARPLDADLRSWKKLGTPAIRSPFPDDFRDPYYFRANGKPYFIVGCAANGLGVATIHRYENGQWTSDGDTFFAPSGLADAGNFWEMPTVTPMGDGRWLFTVTPLSTSYGVRTLYWVGTIDAAGHFRPLQSDPQTLELSGLARDGYGMLSPSIFQYGGKTLALGIVPDRASSMLNYTLGYAHLYSFPRELSLDADGNLCQKPYEGLQSLRTEETVQRTNFTLSDAESLSPIEGRSVELQLSFRVDTVAVGFNLLKNNYGAMKVYLDPRTQELVVDMTTIGRKPNDTGVFDGIYRATIPSGLNYGDDCTLHVYFDHSILDIFINDRYASSIRVFPYDYTANGCEVFALNGTATIESVQAWGLGEITHYSPATTDLVVPAATASGEARKILRGGQFYIQSPDGTLYNLLGNRLQ